MTMINVNVLWLAFSICFFISIFLRWRVRTLQLALRAEKNDAANEEFSLISDVIEEERSRISAELHDELGTLVSVIHLDLELVMHESSTLSPYAESRLNEIKRNLGLVIGSIRQNIWNLSSPMFDKVDLAFALRELCHKLDRYKGTHVTFVQSGAAFTLNEKLKLNLFRITQELLTNSIKHSSAWNISVHLHWEGQSSLTITVEDDGTVYSKRSSNGMGWLNIAKRGMLIGATISRKFLSRGQCFIIELEID